MGRWIKPLNNPPRLSETDLLSAQARIVLMSLERRYGVKDSLWSFNNSEICAYNAGNCELQESQCSLLGSSTKVKQEPITPIRSSECINNQKVILPRQNVNTGEHACSFSDDKYIAMQSENRSNKVSRKHAWASETEPVPIKVVKTAPSCDPILPNFLVGVPQINKVQNKDGHQDYNIISLAFPSIDCTHTYDYSQSTELNMTTYAITSCSPALAVQQRSLTCLDNNADIVNRERLKSISITSTPKTVKPYYRTCNLSNHGQRTNNQLMGANLLRSCIQISTDNHNSYSTNAYFKENKDYHKSQKQVMDLPVLAPTPLVSVTKHPTSAAYSSEAHIQQFLHQHVDQYEKRRQLAASDVSCMKNLSRATNEKSEDKLKAKIPSSSHNAKTTRDDQLLIDITSLSPQEREIISFQLETVGEVCLMVVYHDNSTSANVSFYQLNDRFGQSAKGVLVYAENRMMLFPLVVSDPSLIKWCRSVLNALLCKETTRKVVVNSKLLVKVLVQKLNFTRQSEVILWHLEDPAVAGWLLKPDDPPCSLKNLRKTHTTFCGDNYNYDRTKSDSKFYFLAKESLAIMEGQRILLKSYSLWQLFLHVEMPLVPVLALMELQPIRVDMPMLLRYSDMLKKNLQKLENQAHEMAAHPFSINSTSQIRQVLYEKLGLDKHLSGGNGMILTTSNNLKSTSEAVLVQMSAYHPLPSVILQYRQLAKMKSTYIEGILELVQDGVVYTHWDQTAAATGRLTSCSPNLQAVPKTSIVIKDFDNSIIIGSEPKTVKICAREPYICGENNIFLAADFQQIELRLLAHLTDDITLRTIFNSLSHFDVFIQLAAKWLSKAEREITNLEREQTKRVVYSIMYGVGKERLAKYLKATPSTAKEIINSFLVSFPAIQHFTQRCVTFARQHGYVETLMGRKRWLPNITHSAAQLRSQAERQAVNFCLQGSAADLCKCTMLRVEEALYNKSHLRARLLLQIHDELVWEMPSDQLQETCEVIKTVMEDAKLLCCPFLPGLKVPLSVHLTHGTSWARLSPQMLRPPDVAAFSVSRPCTT